MRNTHVTAAPRRLLGLSLALLAAPISLQVPGRAATAQAPPPGKLASVEEMLPCEDIRDYLSETDLAHLKGLGLQNREIAAVALIAHHTEQTADWVARQFISGEKLTELAEIGGLSPRQLMATAGKMAAGLNSPAPGAKGKMAARGERVAGMRQETPRPATAESALSAGDHAALKKMGLRPWQIAGAAYLAQQTGQPALQIGRRMTGGKSLSDLAAEYEIPEERVLDAVERLAPQAGVTRP